MDNIFSVLAHAESTVGQLHDLQNRNVSLALGKIVNATDPLGWGRVQVALAVHGGKSFTPWYHRTVPLDNCYPPSFLLGRTAVCGYADGDPNQGVVLGVLVNAVNKLATPAPEQFNYFVGATGEGTRLTIDPLEGLTIEVGGDTGSRFIMTENSITLKVGDKMALKVTGSTVTICGKDVTVVGARDTDGEHLVTKGYDALEDG